MSEHRHQSDPKQRNGEQMATAEIAGTVRTESAPPPMIATSSALPMNRFIWMALAVVATVAAALLVWQFRSVLLLFVAALVLAATIRPASDWLATHGLGRAFATILLVLMVVIGLLLFIGTSAYVLAEDLPRAVTAFQMKYAEARTALSERPGWQGALGSQLPSPEGLEDMVVRTQLEPLEAETVAAMIPSPDDGSTAAAEPTRAAPAESTSEPTAAGAAAETAADANAPATSQQRVSGLLRLFAGTTSSVVAILAQFLLLVFLSLYWSLEREWFERFWLSLVPATRRQRARSAVRALEDGVGAHVRSELLQVIIAFGLLYTGFRLMGVEYPLLMAWAAALAWMIPLVGWVVALLPVLALGLLSGQIIGVGAAVYVTLVFGLLEFIVEPRLDMRRRAGSILGLIVALVMLQAFGIVGLLVASPIAVAVEILAAQWRAPTSSRIPPRAIDSAELLTNRRTALVNAVDEVDDELPLPTRDLYERLQVLLMEAKDAL
jgi:predicted PurR-regulated permease PerM